MTIWITKYLFTRGLYSESVPAGFMSGRPTRTGVLDLDGNDWHTSRDAAVDQAKKMIKAKRKSIAKQLNAPDVLEAELAGDSLALVRR